MAYLEHAEASDRHRALQAWGQQEKIWQEEMSHSRESINTGTIEHAGNLLSGDNTDITFGSHLSTLTANSPTMANAGAMAVARGVSAAPQNRTGGLYQWSQPDLIISTEMGIFAIESKFYDKMEQQNRDHFLLFGSSAQPINTFYRIGGRTEGITPARIQITASVKAVLMIFDRWQIPDAESAKILGADGETYLADLRNGLYGLRTRDNQDRAKLVVDIFEGVFSLVRDSDVERGWIRAKRPDLDGRSIVDLMTEGSMLSLLKAKGFVDYANGR